MTVVRLFDDGDLPGEIAVLIRTMVEAAFDGEFSEDDWEHTRGGWRVVVFDGGDAEPVAHAAVVDRTIHVAGRPFRTGYVEGVATRIGRQGQGLGTTVMRSVNDLIRARFELGALSTERHDFYQPLGWERWRGPSHVRHGASLVRTEDEDDGVMVLRFGPSVKLDLRAAIDCERRAGDDW